MLLNSKLKTNIINEVQNILIQIDNLFSSKENIDKIIQEVINNYFLKLLKVCLKLFIERLDEEIKDSPIIRQEWKVVRKDYRKLLTPYCEIEYVRRYYRNKNTKEYCYLVDQMLGIDKYQRITDSLEKKIIELSKNLSYEEVIKEISKNNIELTLSKQTIKNKKQKKRE